MNYRLDLEAADDSRLEREADRAAVRAMISDADWKRFRQQGTPSRAGVIQFAASVRVHPAIVAGRFRKETSNFRAFSDLIGNRKARAILSQHKP